MVNALQRVVVRGVGGLRLGMDDEARRWEAEVRSRLATDAPPLVQRSLELDIHARMATGEYRAAVIETASLFESWLRPALERKFASAGLDTAEIEAEFRFPRGNPRGVRNVIIEVVPKATGVHTFEQTPEFARWDAARELRNDLVHGHRHNVTETEGASAVQAIFDAIRYLQSNLALR